MYIKKKGTEKPIEVQVAPGPQRDSDIYYAPDFVNPDSVFVFRNPNTGIAMLHMKSNELNNYQVCTKDGRPVCELCDMADALVRTCTTVNQVNEAMDREIQALDDFTQLNGQTDIWLSSNKDEYGVGIENPTLEVLGKHAVEYDLFYFDDRSGDPFDERIAALLERISNTSRAVDEMHTVEYGELSYAFINGENLLSQRHLRETYELDLENAIIIDKGRGTIDINGPAEVLDYMEKQLQVEAYYDDYGYASATFEIGSPYDGREHMDNQATIVLECFVDAAKQYEQNISRVNPTQEDPDGLDDPSGR